MRIFLLISTLFVLLFRLPLAAQPTAISDPVRFFVDDNKLVNIDSVVEVDKHILVRMGRDFDNDGIEDVAVSDTYFWGNAGGDWDIFLGRKDSAYRYLGEIFFHADAIAVVPLRFGIAEIETYHRQSAGEGSLVHYELSSIGIREITTRHLVLDRSADAEEFEKYHRLLGDVYQHPLSECCRLSDYISDKNCIWQPGYYIGQKR